jgi:hypothetical protein
MTNVRATFRYLANTPKKGLLAVATCSLQTATDLSEKSATSTFRVFKLHSNRQFDNITCCFSHTPFKRQKFLNYDLTMTLCQRRKLLTVRMNADIRAHWHRDDGYLCWKGTGLELQQRICYNYFNFNLLKPNGYVMHLQFNIQQLYALPTLYLCVLYLSEYKQRLVLLTP